MAQWTCSKGDGNLANNVSWNRGCQWSLSCTLKNEAIQIDFVWWWVAWIDCYWWLTSKEYLEANLFFNSKGLGLSTNSFHHAVDGSLQLPWTYSLSLALDAKALMWMDKILEPRLNSIFTTFRIDLDCDESFWGMTTTPEFRNNS